MKAIITFDIPKGFVKSRKLWLRTIGSMIHMVFGFNVKIENKLVKKK